MYRDASKAADAADKLRLGPEALLADGLIRGILHVPESPGQRLNHSVWSHIELGFSPYKRVVTGSNPVAPTYFCPSYRGNFR